MSRYTPEQIAEIEEQNAKAAARVRFTDELAQMWDNLAAALPVEQRAALRIVKIAVVDALNAQRYDEGAALIAAQAVPVEFAEIQQAAVQMLNEKQQTP